MSSCGVVGVALRALDQPAQRVVPERGAGEGGRERAQLGGVERREVEPLDARVPRELGEHRPQRVAAVQVVGAQAGDQQQVLVAQPRDEEPQHVPAGGVGPVQVLEHEHAAVPRVGRTRRAPRRCPSKSCRRLGLVVRVGTAAPAAPDGSSRPSGGALADDRARPAAGRAVQPGQRLRERQVRQPDLARGRRSASRRPGRAAGRGELADAPHQPGLADAGVRRRPGPPAGRPRPRGAARARARRPLRAGDEGWLIGCVPCPRSWQRPPTRRTHPRARGPLGTAREGRRGECRRGCGGHRSARARDRRGREQVVVVATALVCVSP